MIEDREDTPANQRLWSEKKLEQAACRYVRAIDGIPYKFVSPAHASVPDRLICLPATKPFFVEFKKWGAKPTDNQFREFRRLFNLGNDVYFIDNVIDFTAVIDAQIAGMKLSPWIVSPPGKKYDDFWLTLK